MSPGPDATVRRSLPPALEWFRDPVNREVAGTVIIGAFLASMVALFLPANGLTWSWYILVFLIIAGVVLDLAEIKIRHGDTQESLNLFDAAVAVAALLLHPAAAVLMALLSVGLSQILQKRPLIKIVFNVFVSLASTATFVTAYHLLAGDEASLLFQGEFALTNVAALLTGALLFCLVNLFLLYRLLSLIEGTRIIYDLRRAIPLGFMAALGNASLGAITAVIIQSSPWLLPIIAVVASVLMLTYREAATVQNDEDRAAQLSSFASLLASRDTDQLPEFLALLRRAFHADAAVAVLDGPTPLTIELGEEGVTRERPPTPEELAFLTTPRNRISSVLSHGLPEPWKRAVLAPLESGGSRYGVLVVASSRKGAFDAQASSLLISLAGSYQVAKENVLLLQRIQAVTSSQTEAVLMVDALGAVTFANPAAHLLLAGCGGLEGRPIVELLSIEGAPPVLRSTGTTSGDEATLVVLSDGIEVSRTFVDYSISPVEDLDATLLVFRDVTERVAARAALEESHAALIRLGRTLQESLLPPLLPVSEWFTAAARYYPGSAGLEIGGDFYDFEAHSDSDWSFMIGDVCGRGAEAAALTALARHTFGATASKESSPASLLQALNDAVLRHRGDDRFATVAAARLSRSEEAISLTVSHAGHPPVLVVRTSGEVVEAGSEGMLVGVVEDLEAKDSTLQLSSGDVVVFYTDGVLETRNEEGVFFQDIFYAELSGGASRSAEEVAEHLEHSLARFRGSAVPDDDTAFMVLSIL